MSQEARDLVKTPALGLKITAGVGIFFALVGIAFNILGVSMGDSSGSPLGAMGEGIIGILLNVVGIGVGIFLWIAGGKMARLESYNMALAAAIVSIIPCLSPCCILGLVFGIWAVVVLAKPEVKEAFAAAE